MASIWKHPNSPFYTACFNDETGRRLKRSTKLSDRKQAMKAAQAFEDAVNKARCAELTHVAAFKVINDLVISIHGDGLDNRSISQHITDYQASLVIRKTKESTLKRYLPVFDGFLAHLGEARSKARLASVTPQELESFRNAELKSGKSSGTADFALKVLNGLFQKAFKHGTIPLNPVGAVDALDENSESEERHPFTDDQVSALLAVADVEWQGMILMAYHTGIRLNDAANLTRQNIEGGKLLKFQDQKTAHRKKQKKDKVTVVVMSHDLRNYLKSLPVPMAKDAPLFPSLFGKRSGSAGGLSNAFGRLMVKAGIDPEQGVAKEGKGRRFSALSFHSFRHTMISRLANSGAPGAVSKAISGHSTDVAHSRYIHLDTSAQEKVVAKAPRLWKPTKASAA
jgi:integrase